MIVADIAMAHGRPVLCSTGAGAADVLPGWYRFPARDVEQLASKIAQVRDRGGCVGDTSRPIPNGYPHWRRIAEQFTWDKVRERYKTIWRSLL